MSKKVDNSKQIKLDRLLDLAKQIGELYPNATTSLMVHSFDIKNFNEEKWDIEASWVSANKDTCLSATPKQRIKGVTLTLFD